MGFTTVCNKIKQTNIITHQPKSFKIPNIIDIKSITIEYQKTFHQLSKTIRHGKNVCQVFGSGKNCNNPLYNKTTKREQYLNENNAKIHIKAIQVFIMLIF